MCRDPLRMEIAFQDPSRKKCGGFENTGRNLLCLGVRRGGMEGGDLWGSCCGWGGGFAQRRWSGAGERRRGSRRRRSGIVFNGLTAGFAREGDSRGLVCGLVFEMTVWALNSHNDFSNMVTK